MTLFDTRRLVNLVILVSSRKVDRLLQGRKEGRSHG